MHKERELRTVNPYAYAAWERCDGTSHWVCVPDIKRAYRMGACTCQAEDIRRREITTALGAIDSMDASRE